MFASPSGRTIQAFGLAIVLEALLLACATFVLAGSAPVMPVISEPVAITLVSEEPPPPAPSPQKLPDPPVPKPKLAPPKVKPLPSPPLQTPPPPAPAPAPVAPIPAIAKPNAFTEPVKPQAPLPTPSGKADPGIEYAAKVRAAVQAAVFYPPAAAALRFSGRVRLEFHLRDAVPGAVSVLVTSGMGIIDRAALQSVQNARYPEPPADMRGSDRVYQVWVEFNQ